MKKTKRIFTLVMGLLVIGLSGCRGKYFASEDDLSDFSSLQNSESSAENSDSLSNSDSSNKEKEDPPDLYSAAGQISATDGLGRFFDSFDSKDDDKQVGMFYFLWSGQHDGANYDISKLTLEQIKNDTSSVGAFHYWNEPLYGYYDSGDPWVFRKHLELFTMANIDYIVFDVTNSYIYKDVLNNILPILLEYVEAGWDVPKVLFYTYSNSKVTVTLLYNAFYNPETENGKKYAPLWYRYRDTNDKNSEEKPWIVAKSQTGDALDYENCSEEIRNFFYLKEGQWPNEPMRNNGLPWMSWADASTNYALYNHDGIMSVSVAQHTSGAFSDSVLLNDRTLNRGRGWTRSSGINDKTKVGCGANFQDQWDYALLQKDKVNNVFVTGWNEWIAQKQAPGNGRSECYFVDLYNEEFSRDIEMPANKDGYGDNFYLQLAANIRAFKNATESETEYDSVYRTVDIDGDASEWYGTRRFYDFEGDTAERNYKSASSQIPRYVNSTGRNDISLVRVAHDAEYFYLYLECVNDITAYEPGDKTWMNVFLEVEGAKGSAWENYQYVLNRTVSLVYSMAERLNEDGSSSIVGSADLRVNGKYLALRVKKSLLGITGDDFTIRFKVADHVTDYKDIMHYYIDGDSAPVGRLNYTYKSKQ